MKKWIGALVAATLVFTPLSAVATVKAGASCKKAGATTAVAGKKFTCVKTGKRLVWNKGVSLPKPKPTAAPTPAPVATPIPTPTPAETIAATPIPIPVPAPIIEKTPTGFNDLVENFRGVYLATWNSSSSKIANNAPVDVKQNIVIGPNTKLPNPQTSAMFTTATRLFSGHLQPKRFDAVYFTFDDRDWASKKLLEFYGNPNLATEEVDRGCKTRDRCNGASASVPLTDHGRTNFAIPDTGYREDYGLKGGIEIHEYAHLVQFMQFQGKPTARMNGGLGLLPQWFIEGHAHVAGNAGSASTLEEYKRYRSFWFFGQPTGLPDYSQESIQLFYEKLAPGKFEASVFNNVYTIGFFTVEAMVAIKGIDSPVELIKLVSDGATWDQAFLKVYGITWNEAAPILAKTVSRIFLER
jgi:hypothetical protein